MNRPLVRTTNRTVRFLRAAVIALGLLPVVGWSASVPLHREVLVFVPAYEGSQLFDPDLGARGDDPVCVWGNFNVFLSSTRYFALRMPNPLIPHPLLRVGPIDIYHGFIRALTTSHADAPKFAPYTEGADLFIFPYDWRQEMATVSAPQLARALESYAQIHAARTGIPAAETRFIIVTHSMGGLVARTWLRENPAWASRIAGMYLVGPPNLGSIKAARTVICGPDSLKAEAHGFPGVLLNLIPSNVDQNVTKLTGITRPSLYELLPYDNPHWTRIEPDGTRRQVAASSLLEAATWEPYWPSAELEQKLFIDGWLQPREREGRKKIVPADWEFCQDPAYGQLKELLRQTAAWRSRQGSLQETASLLSRPGEPTRLRLILGTGLKTPSGMVSWGEHDSSQAYYTYEKGDDGDGTVAASSALAGFAPTAANVKILHGVPHGSLMISHDFISYFLSELTGQPLVAPR